MRKSSTLLLLVALFALSACALMDKTTETNKTSAERLTNEVWNGGNMEVLNELVAADFVRHNPASWWWILAYSLSFFGGAYWLFGRLRRSEEK